MMYRYENTIKESKRNERIASVRSDIGEDKEH